MLSVGAHPIAAEPFYRWLNTYHWLPLTVLGFILLAIGGWDLVNWGLFLHVVVGLHATWSINSVTHSCGDRRFAPRDDSRNAWRASIPTFGEAWHNNHHAHPTSARYGLTWYEVDLTWTTLRLLRSLGLAWNVDAVNVSPGTTGRDRGLRPVECRSTAGRSLTRRRLRQRVVEP